MLQKICVKKEMYEEMDMADFSCSELKCSREVGPTMLGANSINLVSNYSI